MGFLCLMAGKLDYIFVNDVRRVLQLFDVVLAGLDLSEDGLDSFAHFLLLLPMVS